MSTEDIIEGWMNGVEPYELRYSVFQACRAGDWPDTEEQVRYWKPMKPATTARKRATRAAVRVLIVGLALCATGCGDGRIVRALNAAPAAYPLYMTPTVQPERRSRFWREMDAWEQESRLMHMQSELDDITDKLNL